MCTEATAIRSYLSRIGRRGGRKSRRALSPEDARDMVRVREARRAYRRFHMQCFWYMKPNAVITKDDLPIIVKGLRSYGGHAGYRMAGKLCR